MSLVLSSDKPFVVKMPHSLQKLWEEKEKQGIDSILEKVKDPKGRKLAYESQHLHFSMDTIRELFDKVISEIIKEIDHNMHDVESLDAAIVVGGFAMSDYLIDRLSAHFETHSVQLVRPQDAELCVLHGAVLYGQNQDIVRGRVTQYTYGIGMTMKYIPGKHDTDDGLIYTLGQTKMANNVFRKHVTIGEYIRTGEWCGQKHYYPEDEKQNKAIVCVYASSQKDPVHTTAKYQCMCIGDFELEFPPGRNRSERTVLISFCYSGTIICVKVVKKNTGEVLKTFPIGCQEMKTKTGLGEH